MRECPENDVSMVSGTRIRFRTEDEDVCKMSSTTCTHVTWFAECMNLSTLVCTWAITIIMIIAIADQVEMQVVSPMYMKEDNDID